MVCDLLQDFQASYYQEHLRMQDFIAVVQLTGRVDNLSPFVLVQFHFKYVVVND